MKLIFVNKYISYKLSSVLSRLIQDIVSETMVINAKATPANINIGNIFAILKEKKNLF
jgi:hypothetical protein